MAKMSFDEFMKAKEEYAAYLNGEEKPEEKRPEEKKPEAAPEEKKPEAAPEEPDGNGPAEEYKKELNEIREQLAIMAKALSPSLGDVDPVGIDDVVTRFFKE